MANPITFLAKLNGSLSFQDRAGTDTLTASGAVLWAPAKNARINWVPNPIGDASNNAWVANASGVRAYATGLGMRITGAATDDGAFPYLGNINGLGAGVLLTVGFDVTLVSGAGDWAVEPAWRNAAGSNISSGSDVPFTATATPTRHVIQFTAVAGAHRLFPKFIRASNAEGEIIVTKVTVEVGDTDGSWFAPEVLINPVTGQLGSTYDSPSVSRVQLLDLESTINHCTNPLSESAHFLALASGSGHTASTTRSTGRSWLGSASSLLSVSVLGTMPAYYIGGASALQVAATPGQAWSGQVRVAGTGTGRFMIAFRQAGGAYISGTETSDIVLTDTWTEVQLENIVAPALTAWIEMRWQARTTGDFYLDAAQLEQKATCTPFAAGSMGTGFAWTGTANASTSTRAATLVYANLAGETLSADVGHIACRQKRLIQNVTTGAVSLGDEGGAVNAYIWLYQWDGDNVSYLETFDDGDEVIQYAGATVDDGDWHTRHGWWSLAAGIVGYTEDADTPHTDTYTSPPGPSGPLPVQRVIIGADFNLITSGAQQIGPVAVFGDQLSSAEIAALNALDDWEWSVANRIGESLTGPALAVGLGLR